MDDRFAKVAESLEPSFRRLMATVPVKIRDLPKDCPSAGIYLLSEDDRHLYVGRSNGIRGRLGRHSRPGATHRMAAFAFRLAREATGQLKATYTKAGSRAQLMESAHFKNAFQDAKARIREMDVRASPNPTRHARPFLRSTLRRSSGLHTTTSIRIDRGPGDQETLKDFPVQSSLGHAE